jgi:hypothetical protein
MFITDPLFRSPILLACEVPCFQMLTIQWFAAVLLKRVEPNCFWVLLAATKSSTAGLAGPLTLPLERMKVPDVDPKGQTVAQSQLADFKSR